MGFFSGVRRRIKKLIPKEVRPFIPYLAAAIPGAGMGLGALGAKGAMGSFLRAGLAKGLTDDEADLKDILRTGAIAAAPQALDAGIGKLAAGDGRFAEMLNATKTLKDGSQTLSFAEKVGSMANPETLMGQAKLIGGQGSVDYGIKAAELNEDALADYNRMLAEQGIADKAGRRAAIRAIYSNTGTWDMDEVDSMLDTYGYRTGGRVGYAEGDMVLPMPSQISPERQNQIEGSQIAEQAYNEIMEKFMNKFPGLATGEETLEEMVAMLQAEDVMDYTGGEMGILGLDRSMDMITPESAERSARRIMRGDTRFGSPEFNMGGRVNFGDGGETEKERRRKKFKEGFEYAQEGLSALEDLEDEYKPLPIRELRLADGGKVSELKAAYQRYLEMARKDGSKKIIPFEIFAEEFARENFARGGITDINMEEQIDTPSGDMMMDENIQVASDPSPMDELDSLSLMLFRKPLSELTDDEYEDLKDFASQQSLKPGLIDEYRNYKYNAEEQGQTPMSPRDYFRMEFGAARMGVKKGGPIELNINVGGNNMEDIKGQTAGPDWYYDRIQALEFEFGDELTEEEIADIAYDSDKFYDKMGYDPGDYKKGGKVIELMPKGILYKGKAKDYPGIKQLIKDMKKKGTRPKKAEGGLMNLGGKEMDLRGGGFVPMGAKERADDVPARLSKNEFVMTADAVRGAGGGSVQKGADLMYDQMKRLEGQA